MSRDPDFILRDRIADGEWELTRSMLHARAIHLHDDHIRYILDTLHEIPTHSPSINLSCCGLNMCGVMLIEQDEASGDGVLSNVPPKIPQTLQENRPLDADTKKADAENPLNSWVCLASAISAGP